MQIVTAESAVTAMLNIWARRLMSPSEATIVIHHFPAGDAHGALISSNWCRHDAGCYVVSCLVSSEAPCTPVAAIVHARVLPGTAFTVCLGLALVPQVLSVARLLGQRRCTLFLPWGWGWGGEGRAPPPWTQISQPLASLSREVESRTSLFWGPEAD